MENGGNDKLIWRNCKQKRAAERTYERHVSVLQMGATTIGASITPLIAFFLLARETKYGTQAAYKNSNQPLYLCRFLVWRNRVMRKLCPTVTAYWIITRIACFSESDRKFALIIIMALHSYSVQWSSSLVLYTNCINTESTGN